MLYFLYKLTNTNTIISPSIESKGLVPACTSQSALMSAPITMPYSCLFSRLSDVMQVYDLRVC